MSIGAAVCLTFICALVNLFTVQSGGENVAIGVFVFACALVLWLVWCDIKQARRDNSNGK